MLLLFTFTISLTNLFPKLYPGGHLRLFIIGLRYCREKQAHSLYFHLSTLYFCIPVMSVGAGVHPSAHRVRGRGQLHRPPVGALHFHIYILGNSEDPVYLIPQTQSQRTGHSTEQPVAILQSHNPKHCTTMLI